jgi:hypothetical protein
MLFIRFVHLKTASNSITPYTLTASRPVLESSAACSVRMGSTQSTMNSFTCWGARPTKSDGSRRSPSVLCTAAKRLSLAILESRSLSAPSSLTYESKGECVKGSYSELNDQ